MDLALIVLMLALSAFFSGSEIAFVGANRLRAELLARRRGFVGSVVTGFLKNPDAFLTTTLVGNNLALVAYSTLLAFYLEPPVARMFESASLGHPLADVATLCVQTLIATSVVLVFGEILPKSVVREVPTRAVFAFAIPLRLTYYVLSPFIKIAGWTSSLMIRLLGVDAESLNRLMRRDFEWMVQQSVQRGELALDREESELLSNVFAMSSVRAKESMVPRTDVEAVQDTASLDEVRQHFINSGHSKLPVYEENIDNVVGIAFAYDLFRQPASLREMMRPVTAVPETKPSKELLREFLKDGISVAIVVDEYGGMAGLVTLEDLLEELFGDIQDEFDSNTASVRWIDDDSFIASGKTEIDELRAKYNVDLPDGDYETIAGYVLERLGTIPPSNESFEVDGYRFVVLQASANRVELLKVVRP